MPEASYRNFAFEGAGGHFGSTSGGHAGASGMKGNHRHGGLIMISTEPNEF